jgi:Family of unknown function (DUF6884)
MSSAQVKAWADRVVEQLKAHADLQHDHFVLLAGEKYRKYLVSHLASYDVPFQGMPIGKQLQVPPFRKLAWFIFTRRQDSGKRALACQRAL